MKTWKVQAVSGDSGAELAVMVEAGSVDEARKEASRNLPAGYFVGQVVAASGTAGPGMISTIRIEPDAAEIERQNAQTAMLRQLSAEMKAVNVDLAGIRASTVVQKPTRAIASGVLLAIIAGAVILFMLSLALAMILPELRAITRGG